MKKYKDKLAHFTIKLSDDEHARLAAAAELQGKSIGQLVRDYANTLPEVPQEVVFRWREFKHETRKEKVPDLVGMESRLIALKAAANSMPGDNGMRARMEVVKLELEIEELKATKQANEKMLKDFNAEFENMTMLEQAELEDAAEKGDSKARATLDALKAYKAKKYQVQL